MGNIKLMRRGNSQTEEKGNTSKKKEEDNLWFLRYAPRSSSL
jgi:hypothetical protein